MKKPTVKKSGGKKKGNGTVDLECYLTTACSRHLQLGDNCHELRSLRAYRDSYLMQSPEGRSLVLEYYRTAPFLVQAIEADQQKDKVYAYIYSVIECCVELIEKKTLEAARLSYERMVKRLEKMYLPV